MNVSDLTVLIGEFVATEIEEVKEVLYERNEKSVGFTVVTETGKCFIIKIEEIETTA